MSGTASLMMSALLDFIVMVVMENSVIKKWTCVHMSIVAETTTDVNQLIKKTPVNVDSLRR